MENLIKGMQNLEALAYAHSAALRVLYQHNSEASKDLLARIGPLMDVSGVMPLTDDQLRRVEETLRSIAQSSKPT